MKTYDNIEEIYLLETMNELAHEIFHQGENLEFRERAMFCQNIANVELALEHLKEKMGCESEVEALKQRGREYGRKALSNPHPSVRF